MKRYVKGLTRARNVVIVDPTRQRREMQARIDEWRQLFGRQPAFSRQFLQKALVGKIACVPLPDETEPKYELRIRLSLGRLFVGLLNVPTRSNPLGDATVQSIT